VDLPDVVKAQAEMRFYNGTELEDVYKVYGVDPKKGAVTVIRPDGYVGIVAELKDTSSVHAYFKGCLREVKGTVNGAS
jgi:phenol 2-monooxygenase